MTPITQRRIDNARAREEARFGERFHWRTIEYGAHVRHWGERENGDKVALIDVDKDWKLGRIRVG